MTDINIGNWRTIEIFRAGTHTAMEGQEISFSDEDIDSIAAAYNGYHRAGYGAPLCLGHPASNGPAYGETAGLISKNGRLFALVKPDNRLLDMVQSGLYKKCLPLSTSREKRVTRPELVPGIFAILVFSAHSRQP